MWDRQDESAPAGKRASVNFSLGAVHQDMRSVTLPATQCVSTLLLAHPLPHFSCEHAGNGLRFQACLHVWELPDACVLLDVLVVGLRFLWASCHEAAMWSHPSLACDDIGVPWADPSFVPCPPLLESWTTFQVLLTVPTWSTFLQPNF